MRTFAATLLLAALATPAGFAQAMPNTFTIPRYTVAIGYNYIHANAPPQGCDCFGLQGGFAQGAVALKDWLRIAGEVTGGHADHIGNLGQNLTLLTYTAGPQAVLLGRRFEPFGQALFGAAHGSDSYFPTGTTASPAATSFALSAGGGVDFNLTHHIAVRAVEAQYLRTSLPNGSNNRQNQLMLGAGLVLHLGGSAWTPTSHTARVKPTKPTTEPQQADMTSTPPALMAPASASVPIRSISANASDFSSVVKPALFDYDSYDLRPDAKAAVAADAMYLKAHPSLQVTVAGFADERGTAEYNLALGEKRAQATRDALIFNGVPPDQLEIVSYGKEVQTCEAENEACFQQNRRASLEPRR